MGQDHVHDIAVSITATDIPSHLVAPMLLELRLKVEAIAEDWLKDPVEVDHDMAIRLSAVGRLHVRLEWDGRRECRADQECRRAAATPTILGGR